MMREGDEVVILYGGGVPYMLRLLDDVQHLFVGDTYLHDEDVM